ncbi:GNAT family N-acetyltransferase [Paenibacillus sp. OAS669]|uniref:GNAT family N-acetyltransferase n=1 Tax=Paenibacillus sp. OAS669 TaxID=2663821 RepID=UPI00178A485A|nr:GNAT family protein [Paenibacillus sp. OAS669]MBE1445471.1 RimJ/RimL family protein N-acetyltransferase [Paenibacillus sp. OAS669]
MNVQSVELTGVRAQLLPLNRDHAEELFAAAAHPDIWTYLPEKIDSIEDTLKWIEKALAEQEKGGELPFVVRDQETGRLAGSTRYIQITPAHRSLEIGWTWYHPSVWRTRINTECKYLLLRHAFEDLHAVRVQFCADKRNDRSNQAIQRLGAIKEGELRRNRILNDGYIRDTCVYSILEEEWPQIKLRLESYLR